MSRFTGRQYKGAQKEARQERRKEAEARNAATPEENRRKNRNTSINGYSTHGETAK